jgi:hypothetical protein
MIARAIDTMATPRKTPAKYPSTTAATKQLHQNRGPIHSAMTAVLNVTKVAICHGSNGLSVFSITGDSGFPTLLLVIIRHRS